MFDAVEVMRSKEGDERIILVFVTQLEEEMFQIVVEVVAVAHCKFVDDCNVDHRNEVHH